MTTFVPGTPRLACTVTGSGPPVVFLHGIGGNRRNWDRQLASLSDRFTAIAWDARGYGDSDDYEGPLAFTDFADDLAHLLDWFEFENAHLVGLSMGARILMDFTVRHRSRVATLTLCDCFYGFRSSLTPEAREEFLALREKPLREGKTFADLAPALIESLVSPNATDDARSALEASILALHTESYLKTLRATVTFERGDSLELLDAPTQLIYGSDDRLTPPTIGEELVELLTDARLAVLPGAGHLSNIEAPEAFNAVLDAFLDAHTDLAR